MQHDVCELGIATSPMPPASFFDGRALGLITADLPHLAPAQNRARTGRLASDLRPGLGALVIVATPLDPGPDGPVQRFADAELTLLLIGPIGNDHGLVKGTLRSWGQRCDQQVVLWKAHNAERVEALTLNEHLPVAPRRSLSEPFDAGKFGLLHALLRGGTYDPARLAINLQHRVSFFRRGAGTFEHHES